MTATPDHVLRNRAAWDKRAAEYAGPTKTLQRPYFGMHRFQWEGSDATEFHLGHGDMIRLLRRAGFEICDLIEIQPPPGSTTRHPIATLEWARQWPCEEVWKARKAL